MSDWVNFRIWILSTVLPLEWLVPEFAVCILTDIQRGVSLVKPNCSARHSSTKLDENNRSRKASWVMARVLVRIYAREG